MVEVIAKMMAIGFSEYEAKVYLSLLTHHPATAYEIAKISGVPTSKVYAVLGKLIDKGITSIIAAGKVRQYIPMEPDEYLEHHKSVTASLIDSLKEDLLERKSGKDISYIWNIAESDYLMDKAGRMIQSASDTLLLSLWAQELSHLEKDLGKAAKLGVKVAMVHFGPSHSTIRQLYPHPIEDTIYQEKGGRGLVLVADSAEVLIGTVFNDGTVEGAWSSNRGFVTLAEDYVKHDVYIMKIVSRLEGQLTERFGKNYTRLRDIFTDEEIANK
jgi:HTH-type transcriptional regulator, sugar sensing transcriptional regulator